MIWTMQLILIVSLVVAICDVTLCCLLTLSVSTVCCVLLRIPELSVRHYGLSPQKFAFQHNSNNSHNYATLYSFLSQRNE
jgi:hypothetical protein